MTGKPQYQHIDFIVLLTREGVWLHDIASLFSVHPQALYSLLYSRGFRLNELKKMPPLPQDERRKVIQEFCKHEGKAKKLRLLLDSYGVHFSDFAVQPFQIVSKHPKMMQCYADLVFLLIQEGIKTCDIASIFSVDPKKVSYLLRSHGVRVRDLKNMPLLPQEDRHRMIQEFCRIPSNAKKLRLILDSYGTCLQDFAEQPPMNKGASPLQRCTDFVFLLIREGVKTDDVASVFSVHPYKITCLVRSHGLRVRELRHMPPLPQDDRCKMIQAFCKKPSNEEKLRSLLDRYNIRFEDFAAQPSRKLREHANNANASSALFLSARDREIAELRRNGKTLAAIAQNYGITRERVRQIIQRYNRISDNPVDTAAVKKMTFSPTLKQLECRKKILELCRSGLTYKQIADALEVSKWRVYNTIYEYNRTAEHPLTVRPEANKRMISDRKREEIIMERKKGKTIHAIAEQCGVSCGSVNKVIKKAALTRPRRSPKK